MTQLTIKQVVDKTIEIADRDPERVYTSPEGEGGTCYYVHTEAVGDPLAGEKRLVPGCLFGHALHELGIPFEAMYDADPGCAAGPIDEMLPAFLTEEEEERFRNNATIRSCLYGAQESQDNGHTWGDAVVALRTLL